MPTTKDPQENRLIRFLKSANMPKVNYIEPGPDTFRILLTTDNHVGYMENDQIRGDDSWKTFEEILSIAREQDVDMIVQGGDLFHINAPTKKSYYHVARNLRKYCWCDKPIEYQLVSDPSNAIATKDFSYPAEYDTNINVGIPMYAISGNHDDATGEELLSPLDVLGVSGLLNHFGKVIDNEKIDVYPLLFNKGKTNLALYGLHSIREERLVKTMASGNLHFLLPDTDENESQWFNLMCIHQNHVHRPGVKIIEETYLPTFLDFILWGHEHDCKPVEQNDITGSYILQAGSSIATSLSEGESLDKHVYVLNVKGKDFSVESIKLKSVRPFIIRHVVLSETGLKATSSNKREVLHYLIEEVKSMIEEANQTWKRKNIDLFNDGIFTEADVPLPLIRLRVEYSGGYEVENPRFFSNRFVGEVANINDVVLFYKKKKYNNSGNQLLLSKDELMKSQEENEAATDDDDEFPGNDILRMINNKIEDNELIMLTKKKVTDTLETMIEHDDNKVLLNEFVNSEEEGHIELLKQLNIDEREEGDENKHSFGSLKTKTGSGVTRKDDDNLVTDIKTVKKSFRELAKRIKAETQYGDSMSEIPKTQPEDSNTRRRPNSHQAKIQAAADSTTGAYPESQKCQSATPYRPVLFPGLATSTQTKAGPVQFSSSESESPANIASRSAKRHRRQIKSEDYVRSDSDDESEADENKNENEKAVTNNLVNVKPPPSLSKILGQSSRSANSGSSRGAHRSGRGGRSLQSQSPWQ